MTKCLVKNCPNDAFVYDIYHSSFCVWHPTTLEALNYSLHIAHERLNPKKIIKVPICQFGKKLEIKDIIKEVRYHKGSKNNIGDSPDDYVEIVIENE